jgi:LmbE family N-acetylglucosaminyl deacetylase
LRRRRPFSGPDDGGIRRALCVAAHPDDLEFYCGGTVLMLTRRGVAVDLVLATSGDKGTRDESIGSAELAAAREREQTEAAKLLGIIDVRFLRHPDCGLTESLELRGEFVREIRRSRPDLLLTFDPKPKYKQHPDHRVTGRVAMDAAWPCARDRLTHPTMGPPHETAEAWLFEATRVDLEVDVGAHLEDKINARLLHRSQTRGAVALRARWRRTARVERFVQVDLR